MSFKAFLMLWRGREDLNLRGAFYTPYSLSRGAPSASWVLPQVDGMDQVGGESGIRTHGCFHIAGFQDRCLQPLGHLSVLWVRADALKRRTYLTIKRDLLSIKISVRLLCFLRIQPCAGYSEGSAAQEKMEKGTAPFSILRSSWAYSMLTTS